MKKPLLTLLWNKRTTTRLLLDMDLVVSLCLAAILTILTIEGTTKEP